MIAVHTDQKTLQQLRPFRQPMAVEHTSQFFVAAVFVSIAMHALFANLLCVVVAERTTVLGPPAPSIEAPLVVSLVSLPPPVTAPHDGLAEREAVSAVPSAAQVAQYALFPPEPSRSTEHESEDETVVISKDQGVPEAETPMGKSLSVDAASSMKSEAAAHIPWKRIPEFEAGLVLTSKGQGVMGPEAPEGKFCETGTTPSIDIEAAIAREVGRMSMTESEYEGLRFKSIAIYQKNHPDGPSFAGGGLIAIPFFLKDVITGNGYKWFMQEEQERLKDQERVEFMSDHMDEASDLVFGNEWKW